MRKAFAFFKLTDDICTFALKHDPMAAQLKEQQAHLKVHTMWGSTAKALSLINQSQQIAFDIQEVVGLPANDLDTRHGWLRPIPADQLIEQRDVTMDQQ